MAKCYNCLKELPCGCDNEDTDSNGTDYIVHFRYSTQTGIESWANVSAYLLCTENTTIKK